MEAMLRRVAVRELPVVVVNCIWEGLVVLYMCEPPLKCNAGRA